MLSLLEYGRMASSVFESEILKKYSGVYVWFDYCTLRVPMDGPLDLPTCRL